MNIITNPKLINHFLSVIRSVVNPRSNANYSGIQLTAKDGAVTVFASDGNCTLTGRFETTVLEEGTALVPIMFADILAKQPGDEVTISTEGNSIIIQGNTESGNKRKKTRSSISVIEGVLKEPEGAKNVVFSMNASAFSSVLESVRYAIAVDESRQMLTGLYLEVYPDKAMVTTLDGFRLSHCTLNGKVLLPDGSEGVKGIIPGRTIALLNKIARSGDENEDIRIAMGKTNVAAECGEFRLTSSLVAGEYVDYARILPNDNKIQAKVSKEALKGALDRASVYTADDKNSSVKLTFCTSGTLKVSAKSRFGNTEEEIPADMTGSEADLSINFNAKYLKDTISAVLGDDIIFGLANSTKPATASDGKSDKIELILPVRVFEEKTGAA